MPKPKAAPISIREANPPKEEVGGETGDANLGPVAGGALVAEDGAVECVAEALLAFELAGV